MKKYFHVALLVVVLAALVAPVAGCGLDSPDENGIIHERGITYLDSVTVSPPIGGGNFTLTVVYTYENDPTAHPENIDCRYVTPDSATIYIGSIRPGATSASRGEGEIQETATLPFSVTPKTNGVTPPGTYTVECYTDSQRTAVKTTFILAGEAIPAKGPNVAPTAKITTDKTSGYAPLTVNFSGTGSGDSDGTIASYGWTFGDGSTSTAATVAHTYSAAGTYTATLKVTDNLGATATSTVTITTTLRQYSVYRLEVEMTFHSEVNGSDWKMSWAGEIRIDSDGSLGGELPGVVDAGPFEVTVAPSGAHAGSYKINAPLAVAIGGHAESTAEGRTLHIQQTLAGFQTSITVVEGSVDPGEIKSSIEAGLKPWIKEALADLVLPAGAVPGSKVVAGRWQGSANLLPVR